MTDKIKIRDVGLREIYDSYMGIIRISPNEEFKDDITTDIISGTSITLSDSDGNKLPITFVGKTKQTVVKPDNKLVNLVSVVSKIEDVLFVCKSANIRSTLYFGRHQNTDKKPNLLVISNRSISENYVADAVMYPIDSPYNKNYWNNLESKVTHEQIKNYPGDDLDEKLENYLFEQRPNFYNQIKTVDKVSVNGKIVYITNSNDELIPVLYNKMCVMGNRKDATGRLRDNFKSDYIDNSYGYEKLGSYAKLNENSYITRLSYFDVDKMIWEGISEVTSGKIRHNSPGRYTEMGASAEIDLKNELFHIKPGATTTDFSISSNASRAYSFIDTAPLLATDVEPGLIVYNAMPMKKFAYNALRQIASNIKQGYNSSNQNVSNVKNIFNETVLTPAGTGEKTDAIRLVKNFIVCDGQGINGTKYANHPHVNFKNESLAALMDGKPASNTIYSIISKTINLLDWHSTSGRFLRGQMWNFYESTGEDIVDIKNTYKSISAGDGGYVIEVVECTSENPYSTRKNFVNCDLPYMVNYDSRIERSTHQHFMFSSAPGQISLQNTSSKNTSQFVIAGQALCRKAPNYINEKRNIMADANSLNAIPWYINVPEHANSSNTTGIKILECNYSPYFNVSFNPNNLIHKQANEIEAGKPISYLGGAANGLYFENGYTVREGHNSSGHKHKTKYHYSRDLVGGYEIQQATANPGDYWVDKDENKKYIDLGLSSLPFRDREALGNGNVIIKNNTTDYKKSQTVGDEELNNIYTNVPTPASLNLLPLIRL